MNLSSRLLQITLQELTVIQRAPLFWSLGLRDETKLRGFEESLLRKIFGSNRDEVTGEWRILHDDELYDLYSSLNNIRMIK
jgi:hypothetical protein